MANTSNKDEVNELLKRIEWLENERRKLSRRLTEMEQKMELRESDLASREQRLRDLEQRITAATSQANKIPNVDLQLGQFKDEIVKLIEQYDQRRIQSAEESERLRRVEQESTAREISGIRKEIANIARLKQDMELRQAEESRLSNLIGLLQNRIGAVENRVDDWDQSLTFVQEKQKQNGRILAEIQTTLLEINKRWTPINDRIDVINGTIMRLESSLNTLTQQQNSIENSMKGWLEQIQIGEFERNQKLEEWRRVLDEHNDSIEKFSKEWVIFSDQYKEAKMAIQTLTEWQKQIQQQQRDHAEMLRVESHRMQTRWDDFKLENDKRWRTVEVEAEQRWAAVARHERQFQEQLAALEETLQKLTQDKDLLLRIQTAQADAIKQLPRIWLEEIEKAIQQDPNRRRQPAQVSNPLELD
jgi:chromosome segregation ATPase